MFQPSLACFQRGYGVIDMALLSVIRRWHFREHLSIREICRRTGLFRNTIRKYLCLEGVEPKFKVPEGPGKLDPFADRLSAWLQTARQNLPGRRRLHGLPLFHLLDQWRACHPSAAGSPIDGKPESAPPTCCRYFQNRFASSTSST
jgi:hypothetical protein